MQALNTFFSQFLPSFLTSSAQTSTPMPELREPESSTYPRDEDEDLMQYIKPPIPIPQARKATISWPLPSSSHEIHRTASIEQRIFLDDELVEPKTAVFSRKPPDVLTTEDRKTVLQQGTAGGAVACAMMMRGDHGKRIDWEKMNSAHTTNDIAFLFRSEKLPVKITRFPFKKIDSNTLQTMRSIIQANGSMIVGITAAGYRHVIIDAIDEFSTKLLVRDPYHGCRVCAKVAWLDRTFIGGNVIQVQKNKSPALQPVPMARSPLMRSISCPKLVL
jgi:hypothetical protein